VISRTNIVRLRTAFAGLVVLALAAVIAVASASGAPATTEPIMIVPIQVSLTNTQAVLDDKVVDRGSVVQFRIRNKSSVKRTFSIGGLGAAVKPRGTATILVSFDTRGKFPFVSRAATSVHRGFIRVV